MTFTEGTLQIDIADAVDGRKFDGEDHGLNCMKAVDFIVELEDSYLFIELKDPDDPEAAPERREKFIEKLLGGGLDDAYILGPVLSPGFWSETSAVAVAVGGCSRAVLDVMKALEDATGRPNNSRRSVRGSALARRTSSARSR